MKTRNTTLAWLAAAVLLLMAAGIGTSLEAFQQMKQAADGRKQVFVSLIGAEDLLSSLKDAESGQRGFTITGDESFLEPYLAALGRISDLKGALGRLTSVAAARTHLDAMDPLIQAKLEELARVIDLRRQGDLAVVTAAVKSGEGKRLMDALRVEMAGFIALQEVALTERDAKFQANMRFLFGSLLASTLLAVLVALAFVSLARRDRQHRLDALVHEKTHHLLEVQEQTNKHLLQANVSLQLSQEKLSVTLNSIGDGVIATDATGRVTLLNPQAERLTGWTQAQASDRPVDEVFRIINQQTREPAAVPVTETLARGTTVGLANHTVLIARDGSECAIADSCAPIRGGDDKVLGAVLVFRDVTQEHAVQSALADSTALIQTILNTVADGILTLRAEGGVLETVNPAAARMFGFDSTELIGRQISTLIPGFDPAVGQGDPEANDPGREAFGQRRDGSTFPLEIIVSDMWLGQNRYLTGIVRDITQRKQAEAKQGLLDQRLRDHQYYTRSLIESNIDAIMTTDPAGIITDANRQMEALTGCTRDELIGAPCRKFFTDPLRAEEAIKLVLQKKKVSNYELTARAMDGTETAVSYNATTFYDRDRRLQGVFAAARDVTERKRLDQVLEGKNVELDRARFVAEQANLAKSEFLSRMSHELRSPLNAILGFAQLMESDAVPPSSSQKERITHILTAGWHLLKLIDEILDLAKVESGHVPLSREPVSLAEVLDECHGMIEAQARQRGITLTFPVFDVPHFVAADRTRLKQVFANLLSNAVKYNQPSGTISVDCTRSAPCRTRISVRDTGLGLSAAQLGQLFQPFNRLGQEAGVEEGTGIGLVVAKRLVELMGGTIGAQSTPGEGCVFFVELESAAQPLLALQGSNEAALTPLPSIREGHPHVLLYVEDNKANVTLVEQIIARYAGARLLTAADGKTGIEIARTSQPDVILMDINLPGINGFEALKLLRAHPPTAHIPVIALSANAMPADIERGLKAGFFRYLTKPIKIHTFTETLNLALQLAAAKAANG